MKKFNLQNLVILLGFTLLLFSCSRDVDANEKDQLDEQLIASLKSQSPNGDLSYFILPESNEFSKIPQDPANPISKAKVALGAFLFHETALGVNPKNSSLKGTYSCASCHHAAAGFQAGTFQAIGEGGIGYGIRGDGRRPDMSFIEHDVQPLRSPSAMNGAYQPNQLWNGQFGATHLNTGTADRWSAGTPIETNKLGYQGLETQAIAGLSVHRLDISEDLFRHVAYKKLFDEAFPDIPESKRYTKEFGGLAIAAFERTVLSNKAPFQQYLRGSYSSISPQEKRGAILFFGKAKCVNCHTGPALNSMQFNAIGLADMYDCPEPTLNVKPEDAAHLGRASFTGREEDKFKFKVPQLYNLSDSPFYGHGGTLRSIREVIEYKNRAVPQKQNTAIFLDPEFKPLGLTSSEIDDLEAFLSKSLYDPNLQRYVPSSLPSGQCFPNADEKSKIDLGCK